MKQATPSPASDGAAGVTPVAPSDAGPVVRSPKEVQRLQKRWQQKAADVKEIRLTPRKPDIRVTHFGVAWAPFNWGGTEGTPERQPAYERREIPPESWRTVGLAVEEVAVAG